MAKIGLDRKKRNIRRLVLLIIVIVALAAYLGYTRFFSDDTPEVRTAALSYGDLTSRMYVTAEIQPGTAVQHSIKQPQRVLRVHVSIGEQVEVGDLLLSLDMSELEDQYQAARDARIAIEQSMDDDEKAAAARAAAAEQAQREVERQLNSLSANLTSAVSQLSRLLYTSPTQLEVDPELDQFISEFISNLDPEDPQPDIDSLLFQLENAFTISDNPVYEDIIIQLEKDLLDVSAAAAYIIDNLSGSLDLSAQLSGQLGDLTSLEIFMQDPLAQALAREETAKKQLEEAVPELRAKISGIVGSVGVNAGDMAGPVQIEAGSGLEGILGGSLGGMTSASPSLVTIYDNIRPLAVFQADRYDAGRIEEGMKVQYQYDNLILYGEITKKSRIAERSSFSSGSNLDILGDVSGVSGFSSEPQLRVEMSIKGNNLTDLILGFWIEAEIETARAVNVLLLPAEAMRREIDQYYVYILGPDNVLERRNFQPGIQSDMYVEVVSGLNDEDRVILNPTSLHYSGLQVRVLTDE